MEWIVRFVAIWLLFFLMIDFKKLKVNIWCGVFSILLQSVIDILYIKYKYYTIPDPVISVFGSSLFFILGPAFVIGVLLSQFHPSKKWMQVIYVALMSGVFDFEEFLLIKRHAVIYLNWSYLSSVVINAIIMISLSWFTIIVLKRGEVIK